MALLASACGGSTDEATLIEVDNGATPAALAFDSSANDSGSGVDAPAVMNKVDILTACSDALNDYLLTVEYTTQADIDAIKAQIETEDLALKSACEPLSDLEAIGLTQEDLVNHMFSALPPEALGALVQLSESLLGANN